MVIKNHRLTFHPSLNIKIPLGVYDIIRMEEIHQEKNKAFFGQKKNDDNLIKSQNMINKKEFLREKNTTKRR